MSLERSTIRVSDDEEMASIFLCHNRLDAEMVAQIADALEIETGTPYFLDRFAIPTGVEFIPHIETALANAKGCAIFLGSNGWGPTHLWEAEQALVRYRRDPDFRLIPVALPGIVEADMSELGNGSVFNDINRSDLSSEPPDQFELRSLAAALSGDAAPQYRAPARLTPYQLRRDAARWVDAKIKSEKSAADILYHGEELKEAEAIVANNPDFAVTAEVQPFITAAESQQRRFWRRIAITAVTVSIVTLVLAGVAIRSAMIAEGRRLESLSRALAIQAAQNEAPDRQLLIALEALNRADTTEAQGAVLRMLEKWQPLVTNHRVFGDVSATSNGIDDESVLIGTNSGEIYRLRHKAEPDQLAIVGSIATALAETPEALLVGTLDGQVIKIERDGSQRVLLDGNGRQAYITAITVTDGGLIGIGDHEGRLHILEREQTAVTRKVSDNFPVDAIALSLDGKRLAVTTGDHRLILYETGKWDAPLTWPLTETALDVAFLDGDRIVWLTSTGLLQVARLIDGDIAVESSFQFDGLFTAAKIDASSGLIALGEAGGFLRLSDLNGFDVAFGRIQAHAEKVEGVAILANEGLVVSAGTSGGLAVWSLEGMPSFGSDFPPLSSEPVGLFADVAGDVFAATRNRHNAAIWRLVDGRWEKYIDLVEASAKALGNVFVTLPEPKPDAGEFIDISETLIDQIAFSETGVSWSLWNGALLWQAFEADTPIVLKRANNIKYVALTIRRSGGLVAATDGASGEILMFDTDEGRMQTPINAPAPIETLGFEPQGTQLVVGRSDGKIGIYNLSRSNWQSLPDQHSSPVAGTLFFATDRLLSYGTGASGDRNLVIHDLKRPDASLRIEGQQPGGVATSAAHSAELDAIGVVDLEGKLHLWRSSDSRFVQSLFFAGSYLSAVTFDAVGRRVIAAEGGGAVRSWPLDSVFWTTLICKKAGRPLSTTEWAELIPDDEYAPVCANVAQ